MKKTLLQQLYDGEVYPCEAITYDDPEYRKLNHGISDEKEYFMAVLSPDDWNRFEKLEKMQFDRSSIDAYENFVYGFRLGAALAVETFANGNGFAFSDE